MSFQVAAHQTEHYRVNTPIFEGPLDLLLELIERAELDITTLALAQVTDQYLAYLKNLTERDAAEVSAFLIIATRLVQIKSAALLPRPSIDAPIQEEDPGEALARQLIIYKRFKELALNLHERELNGLRTYLRVAPPPVRYEARLDLSGVSLPDLVLAARTVFFSLPVLPDLNNVVSRPRITIREKIHSILVTLREIGQTTFRSLFQTRPDRVETIVTFLAMLELVKRRIIFAQQDDLFGDIQIQSSSDTEVDEAQVESEFME
ncbi:MAG: segregation/condensation protein A [Anaerolineaceae bacterium]|nr:segregation/condensation protein A [Anaerolineaceae bacterium]